MEQQHSEKVEHVQELAHRLDFPCEIFFHELTGKTTSDAEKALGLESRLIIKCLLLKSKKGELLGAIVGGSDKLDFKSLESVSGYKSLRMASEDDIRSRLGYEIGGVAPLVFYEKGIKTYVDRNVLALSYVIGSGGTPFHGMKFNPSLLVERLGYVVSDISKRE